MTSLQAKFSAAFERLKRIPIEGPMEVGSIRYRLYGLSKQATEGDCDAPMPQKSSAVLRTKWEAWTSFKGINREQAMIEFLDLMQKFEADNKIVARSTSTKSVASTSSASSSNQMASEPGSNIAKVGILYKQRDVFKGWRPRKFILCDSILHYFLEPDDPIPKKSMDISGCEITAQRPIRVGEVEYFPFSIAHPKSSKSYNLSSDSKSEVEDWIDKLRIAASKQDTITNFVSRPEERLLGDVPVASSSASSAVKSDAAQASAVPAGTAAVAAHAIGSDGGKYKPVNPEASLANIPAMYCAKIDKAVEALINAIEPNAPNWEPLFEKSGVVARKRAGDVICVRGDGSMPFCIPDILNLLTATDRMKEYNSQLNVAKMLKAFNNQTGVQVLKFKQVWPTAPRDMVTLYHWRMLEDGRVVMLSFSEPTFDNLSPPDSGTVRAELILGGYVFTPIAGGNETMVTYVVQSDLKGSLPTSVVNLVSSTQPLIVFAIKKVLTDQFSKKGEPSKWAGKPFSYQDLVDIAISNRSGDIVMEAPVSTPVATATATTAESDVTVAKATPVNSNNSHTSNNNNNDSAVDTAVTADAMAGVMPTTVPATSQQASQSSQQRNISIIVFLPLLLPVFLYYGFEHFPVSPKLQGIAFVVSVIACIHWTFALCYGSPRRRIVGRSVTPLAAGKSLVRFPVDLGKLIRYLELKRQESSVEVTMTHMAVKAAAAALNDMPSIKGRIIFGEFYPSSGPAVDIGVSADITDQETVVFKCQDSDIKPVEYIADELIKKTRALQADRKAGTLTTKEKYFAYLPAVVVSLLDCVMVWLGSQLGLSVPSLGIEAFPAGMCTIITSPNANSDADMDVTVLPVDNISTCSNSNSVAPITISIGGIRVLSSIDGDRKLHASHALNFSVTVDAKAATTIEARKFCSKLQSYMSNPFLLDKPADERRVAFAKETPAGKSHTASASVVNSQATAQQLENISIRKRNVCPNK